MTDQEYGELIAAVLTAELAYEIAPNEENYLTLYNLQTKQAEERGLRQDRRREERRQA